MRRVVVSDELVELELRPPESIERYYALSEAEIPTFFSPGELVSVVCPFCGADAGARAFVRWTFQYRDCGSCGSLFVSPRPKVERLEDFRRHSEAGAFWGSVLRETATQRDERVLLPRLEWVANLVAERFRQPVPYGDWGARSLVYLESVADLTLFSSLSVIDPDPDILERCRLEGWLCGTKDGRLSGPLLGAMVVFDLVNAAFSPEGIIETAARSLRANGLLFLTGRAAGFELQTLWESAPHLHPLDHLNVPSLEGLERILQAQGLGLLELSTPGQLDLEMVKGAFERHPSLPIPRWLRYFLESRGEAEHRAFQEFLQRARLSSHFRVAASKPAPA